MFTIIIQTLSSFFEEIKDIFQKKVDAILKENDVPTQIKVVKVKSNNIVYQAQINKQQEMVKKTLQNRQNEIDKQLQPQRDIKNVKDFTRQNTYTALLNEKKAKNVKAMETKMKEPKGNKNEKANSKSKQSALTK